MGADTAGETTAPPPEGGVVVGVDSDANVIPDAVGGLYADVALAPPPLAPEIPGVTVVVVDGLTPPVVGVVVMPWPGFNVVGVTVVEGIAGVAGVIVVDGFTPPVVGVVVVDGLPPPVVVVVVVTVVFGEGEVVPPAPNTEFNPLIQSNEPTIYRNA